MTDEEMAFAQDNYALLTHAATLRDEYHRSLEHYCAQLLREVFPGYEIRTKTEKWDQGPAIRFFTDRWGKSNICLYISSNGDQAIALITLYATNLPATKANFAHAWGGDFSYWTESNDTWHCWSIKTPLAHYTSLLTDFKHLASKFDALLTDKVAPLDDRLAD